MAIITFIPTSLLASAGFNKLQQLNSQYRSAYALYRQGCADEKCSQSELDTRFKNFRKALARYQVTLNETPNLAVKVDMPMVVKPATKDSDPLRYVRGPQRTPGRSGSVGINRQPTGGAPSPTIGPPSSIGVGSYPTSGAGIGDHNPSHGISSQPTSGGVRPCNPEELETAGSAASSFPQVDPPATTGIDAFGD